jgi:predicted PurR-regulated permease PerM
MTLAFAAALYVKGDAMAAAVHNLARRIAGPRGEESLHLAAQAIRAVALGVVVSSIVLAAFSWVGLAVVGIPYATLLAACVFMLNLVQLGPVPVLLPAVVWLYWKGDPGWATALLVWTFLAVALDRVLGPVLIKKSADVSLLIILPGVLGGLIAFGFIGIFIGPMVLAVACTLIAAWASEGDHEEAHVPGATETDG